MLLAVLAIIAGFVLLMYSAYRFILGASMIARRLGVPSLIIGLTIVAFGTSLPELLVSLMAALSDSAELAVGNAIGSNIANVGLVIGMTALITPLKVESRVLKREFPVLVFIIGLVYVVMYDEQLSRANGFFLLFSLALLVCWLIWIGLNAGSREQEKLVGEFDDELGGELMPLSQAVGWFLFGLVLLPISSNITVWGAVEVAQFFGVSELIIGLTIVALGTSLPELAASVMGALRGEHDIALGNIIGSNMFNLLGVIGIPSSITPIPVSHVIMTRDFGAMTFLTLVLFITAYGHKKAGTINRFEGSCLLGCYFAYMIILYKTVT